MAYPTSSSMEKDKDQVPGTSLMPVDRQEDRMRASTLADTVQRVAGVRPDTSAFDPSVPAASSANSFKPAEPVDLQSDKSRANALADTVERLSGTRPDTSAFSKPAPANADGAFTLAESLAHKDDKKRAEAIADTMQRISGTRPDTSMFTSPVSGKPAANASRSSKPSGSSAPTPPRSAALWPSPATPGPVVDQKFGGNDWTQRLPDTGVSLLSSSPAANSPLPPVAPTTPGPGAGGYERLPDTDIYRKETITPGFGPENPNRVPGPEQNAGTTTYTQPGVSGLGGGPGEAVFQGTRTPGGFLGYVGTPETKNMTQEQATAYNVAKLNSQTEALRNLREARNPGITTGNAGRAFGDLVSIGKPGGNFGDEAMQAEKVRGLLTDAARPDVNKHQRTALTNAAASWTAPEQAAEKRQDELGNRAAQQALAQTQQAITQQAGRDTLAGQIKQHQYQADQELEGKKYTADQTLLGHKLTAEQQAAQNQIASVKNRIDAEDAKTRRMGLTQKPESGADERMRTFTQATLLGETATDPKERKMYQEIARKLDPRSGTDLLMQQGMQQGQ